MRVQRVEIHSAETKLLQSRISLPKGAFTFTRITVRLVIRLLLVSSHVLAMHTGSASIWDCVLLLGGWTKSYGF